MHIAFVDESQVFLVGEKCLLYGVYVCADLDWPAQALDEIRQKFEVPADVEIKWTIDTGDRTRNALIKEDLLSQTHGHEDVFLASITRGGDKEAAFKRSLEQIHNHFLKSGIQAYGVVYDRDATPKRSSAEAVIERFPGPSKCYLLAEASSHLTAGLAVADGFSGAYAYIIHKQDIEAQPEVEVHPGLPIRLDALFWEIFRRRIPGEFRWDHDHHAEPDIAMVETGYRHTLGHGLFVDESLTADQMKRLETVIDLYQGCTV
jgi:hypothetical protein